MALEQIVECPVALAKLRSAPLGTLLEGFCKSLLECGFQRESLRRHLSILSRLNEYLRRPKTRMRQTLTAEDIKRFLEACAVGWGNHGPLDLRRVRPAVNRFVEYLRQEGRLVAPVARAIYQPLLEEYREWMQSYRHAAPLTLRASTDAVTVFLKWLGPDATPRGLASLDCEKVEQFVLTKAREQGRSARQCLQSSLRTFFRFARHQGYVRQPLDRAVPTLRTYKLAGVPCGLTEEQAQAVLRSIDRNTCAGRRDYALLHLLHAYGVRGAQVRALRLEDIDWGQDQIFFKACKHGKDVRVPMTREVGLSLLDYLQNARPACSCPQVFLTSRAPYRPLLSARRLSAIVRGHVHAAGIDLPRVGAHSFRHGFATRMVQQGHSLKAIADVLGHRLLSTTFLYTKVDVQALKQVALEWPQEVSP